MGRRDGASCSFKLGWSESFLLKPTFEQSWERGEGIIIRCSGECSSHAKALGWVHACRAQKSADVAEVKCFRGRQLGVSSGRLQGGEDHLCPPLPTDCGFYSEQER